MSQTNILAGAHLKVYVNGRLLGWSSGLQGRIRNPMRAVYGIDSGVASEIIPTTYSVSGQLTVFRGRAQGGAEGLGMVAFAEKLLYQKYSTIELVDIASDAVVMKFIGCMITEQSWTVSPKGLVSGNLAFEGIEYSNEADQ